MGKKKEELCSRFANFFKYPDKLPGYSIRNHSNISLLPQTFGRHTFGQPSE